MLKSMYSGISGMKANQTKMDVVGNNVANVGTTAFKKSSTRFSDTLYQTSIYSQGPTDTSGGINASQVGIGTKVSGIFKNTVQGNIQTTGRTSDLAIDGDGYFKVKTGDNEFAYTRDGSFSIDTDGNLVTAQGYNVVDIYDVPIEILSEVGTNKVISYNISTKGEISYILDDGTKYPKNGGDKTINISLFKNPEGLEALSGNLYGVSANSGEPFFSDQQGNVQQGSIEMSNVDLSEEFTEMIVTTRAFQASSKVITTSDELLQEIINLKR